MSKSPDAFRTISEVADWLETPAHVLRFWESKFTQVKPVKRAGGRRYYRPADMDLLFGIKKLLHDDGMTIKGVQKILREQGVKHVAALAEGASGAGSDLIEDAPFIEVEPATPEDIVVSFPQSKSVQDPIPAEPIAPEEIPAKIDETEAQAPDPANATSVVAETPVQVQTLLPDPFPDAPADTDSEAEVAADSASAPDTSTAQTAEAPEQPALFDDLPEDPDMPVIEPLIEEDIKEDSAPEPVSASEPAPMFRRSATAPDHQGTPLDLPDFDRRPLPDVPDVVAAPRPAGVLAQLLQIETLSAEQARALAGPVSQLRSLLQDANPPA
ncbi:MAG: MerR family transcriptional regulator [Pelagimonas sp.]|jgi:DNA-binding transcriptional MerR regulator|nr:MerR family transcriptional regulator [Pelagimonas sp.]